MILRVIVFPLRFCLFLSEGVHCPDSLIQNYHYWCICPWATVDGTTGSIIQFQLVD
ncbi:hypothetical protein LDZ77_16660 [Bacteroides xylanisolvens]|uniref:Uncharacterized protein n=1 Tax=Bacteroides xylanisolvens TaxID=371601 RepID=A0AAW4T748_9BACE|nr:MULTISPECIES: hypothetical protein [Bacteroides]MCA4533982.1 hypothetical protein [Bacteroides xylanisolvens]MCA4551700.1 hypothetical protein [Bacteroides xylanisolvens]MCA4566817.1 hypothetical protein [Bacteroides xylanisolvens]MCA4570269.1 hypothetical protein [Bacteroides xylanisolvens]MCA4600924.1 hypothetical protein [Bacteroides xylanisolvens]